MHTENQQSPTVIDLITWSKKVQEWNTSSLKESLTDSLEGWLQTDLSSSKEDRGIMLFNMNLLKKGLTLLGNLELEDLEAAEHLLKKQPNVS